MTLARPAIFGEILFDHFPDGSRVLGGAPLNVAAHLARLGVRPLLIGRVGSDAEGREAVERFAELGLDGSAVQRDDKLPTGAVEVRFDGDEPRFEILPDRAWDRIEAAPARAAAAAAGATLLYHGTLAARGATTREALLGLRSDLSSRLFVDINLRSPWTPASRARELAAGASWLKVSRDELQQLLGERVGPEALDVETGMPREAARLRAELAVGRLVVTWGEAGAWIFAGDREPERARAAPLGADRLVDAVGAGDALAATLILGALAGWPDGRSLARGVDLAAGICGIRGAIPGDPSFYDSYRRAWGLPA